MPARKTPAKKAPAKKRPPAKKAPAKKKAPARGRGRANAKKNVITVDFTGVESGGGMPTPDGIYVAEVMSAEQDVSSNGNEMIVTRLKTNIGSTVYDRFMLLPQSLWVLRTALECMGYDVPDGPLDIDVDALIGEKLGIEITNEEYEEKDQPRVTGYLPADLAEEQAASGDDAVEDDDEEDVDDEEVDEEDVDDDDDEEEEPEPEPKPRSRKKKAPAKKKPATLRAGASVTFEDEGEVYNAVIESINDDGTADVVDDEDGEWTIPVDELTKA